MRFLPRPAVPLLTCLGLLTALFWTPPAAHAQAPSRDDILSGVVRIKTFINPDGNTLKNLGRDREGTGIVIDGDGLVLTIGYLMVEAYAAEVVAKDGHAIPANVVGYDHETGFGLLRAIMPLKVRPIELGKSADVKEGDPVVVASFGGAERALPAHVVALSPFAGSWEYLLDRAIYTAPPHPAWSGAALLNREGKLVGVGSLILGDAAGSGRPGNMFVPIDLLPPILADLIADGRVSGPGRPWLGMTTEEAHGRLMVSAVTAGGPAEKAGRAARRRRARRRRRRGEIARRFLSPGVGDGCGRRDRAARSDAGRRDAAGRGEVGQPAGISQAQEHVLRTGRRAIFLIVNPPASAAAAVPAAR